MGNPPGLGSIACEVTLMVLMVWMVPKIDSGEYPALFCLAHAPSVQSPQCCLIYQVTGGVRCPAETSCAPYSTELLWWLRRDKKMACFRVDCSITVLSPSTVVTRFDTVGG